MINPFIITAYRSPDFFCDREIETEQLLSALSNGRNIVLLSLRRMGKTGLIKHVFEKVNSDKKADTFYFDIMNTSNTKEFAHKFVNALLITLNLKYKNAFEKVLKFLTGLNPAISFDPLTGLPGVEFRSGSNQQITTSISEIFNYLEKQKRRIYIAIDEFQQIVNYPETTFEAFLRSHIQHLNNVNFIFSGSQQHILTSMFSSYSRPFFQSSDFLKLERIPPNIYKDFIVEKFTKTNKSISEEIVIDILNWTDTYTFYVQNTFNKIWYTSRKNIKTEDITKAKEQLLAERDYIYSNISNILPYAQNNLLKAIAKNGGIDMPTSKAFINTFKLGTTSTVSSALKMLLEKELVYKENNVYKVYDVFFSKWLEKY